MKRAILVSLVLVATSSCKREEGKGKASAQEHHHRPQRVDPGPRLLSAAQKMDERARDAERLGPDPKIGTPMVDADGQRALRLPGGEVYYSSSPSPNVRKRPDVMSPVEFMIRHPDLLRELGKSMDHAEHGHCGEALVERDNWAVQTNLNWSLAVHVTAANGWLTIDDVEPLGEGWPDTVDQEARDCYVSKFRGHSIPWPTTESLSFEVPLCLNVHPAMAEYFATHSKENP